MNKDDDMMASLNNSTTQFSNMKLDLPHYLLIGVCLLTVLVFIVLGTLWLKKYRSLERTIRDLRGGRPLGHVLSTPDSPLLSPASLSPYPVTLTEKLGKEDPEEQTSLQRNKNRSVTNRLLWRPPQQGPRFTKADLSLLQLIKAGKEGVFYKARMTRGTCKGHGMFTCKITKEGVTPKRMEMEVSIMRKLVHHKNILQLLDWNTTEEPYVLIMEFVSYGTLRHFLQTHKDDLTSDPELQSLLTIASYHIALAMEHLRSKMVVHCDLALRNIMVSRFPWEVKVSEFGLARDLTRMKSRHSSRRKHPRERVPLRWYPPEYFRINYYSFKGDVWAFGIVLWEIQTFGTLPYHDLETPEAVVYHICAGLKNKDPEGCRPEMITWMWSTQDF
uniref:Protein kinase domain-containing protein n=1 Tax=Oncorhynchus tshawytscha TaxID=74940 RepID=A0A8C8F234_ONCTS